jgi:hypothetical protein
MIDMSATITHHFLIICDNMRATYTSQFTDMSMVLNKNKVTIELIISFQVRSSSC